VALTFHLAQQFLADWEYDEAKLKRRFFQKGGSSINRAKVYITKAEEENSQGLH